MIVPAWVIVAATAAILLFVLAGGRIGVKALVWVGIVVGILGLVYWFGLTAAGGDPMAVLNDGVRRTVRLLERLPHPIPAEVASLWLFLNALGLIAAALLGVAAGAIRAVAPIRRPVGLAPPPFVLAGLVTANAAFAFAREPIGQLLGW
jgi:hypothetical protein